MHAGFDDFLAFAFPINTYQKERERKKEREKDGGKGRGKTGVKKLVDAPLPQTGDSDSLRCIYTPNPRAA